MKYLKDEAENKTKLYNRLVKTSIELCIAKTAKNSMFNV